MFEKGVVFSAGSFVSQSLLSASAHGCITVLKIRAT
jgi:hypothetical protein